MQRFAIEMKRGLRQKGKRLNVQILANCTILHEDVLGPEILDLLTEITISPM